MSAPVLRLLTLRQLRHCKRLASTSTSADGQLASFVADLSARKLISDSHPSNILEEHLANLRKLPSVVYAGFDPTAPSLHVGNLVVLLSLFRSSSFGCEPVVIVGGATALIGDPSGRSTPRERAGLELAHANKLRIQQQIEHIWQNASNFIQSPRQQIRCIDNYTWYEKIANVELPVVEMGLLEFLSTTRDLKLGEMLRTRAIRSRLDAAAEGGGVPLPEFVYQALQAHDWKCLAERHRCFFQLGGSDQLGHLDIGAHFIARTLGKWAGGVCLPLLTDAAGQKIGKSSGGGGAWLDASLTSPFHFYQFFRQLHDNEAAVMYQRLSLRPVEEVDALLTEHSANLSKWIVQTALAEEMTTLVHGKQALTHAQNASSALFHGSMADVEKLPPEMLQDVFGSAVSIRRSEVATCGELAERTRSDKKDVVHLMRAGAFKVNGVKKMDPAEGLLASKLGLSNAPSMTLIGWGKRKFQLVKWVD